MTSWKAASSGTALSVSWANAGTAVAARTQSTAAKYRLHFMDPSSKDLRKNDYTASGSDFELAGVDPFLLEDGPEVLGQPPQDIAVREPPVASLAPSLSPGIA